jgi:hypothetical protein
VRIPLACTLGADAATGRVEEWRGFLARSIVGVERAGDRQLRLRLDDSTIALTAAVDLAQREKACCAFFEFSLELEATSRWLVVRVPSEATAMLAEFATLLPASG